MRALSTAVLAVLLCSALVVGTGCYTGHAISLDKLREVSNEVERGTVEMETDEGETVPVTPETMLVVTDNDGLRHPLLPFSFQVSNTQLVAPEQDLILGLSTIEGIEVRRVSTIATVGLVAIGLVAAGSMAATVLLTAGDESFE